MTTLDTSCAGAGACRQGAQARRPRSDLEHRDRCRLDGARLQPGRHPRASIVATVGLVSPIVVLLAFIPMLFISFGYKELNKADPDCGTTFTWGDPDVRPEDRVDGRLGDHRRRRPRHGQPGPGRRPVRVPAVQRQRHRRERHQRMGAPGRGFCLIVAMTCDLLRRASRSRPTSRSVLLGDRDPDARRLRRRGPGEGASRVSAPSHIDPTLVMVQPGRHHVLGTS